MFVIWCIDYLPNGFGFACDEMNANFLNEFLSIMFNVEFVGKITYLPN